VSTALADGRELGRVRNLERADLPAMERLEQLCHPAPWTSEMLAAELTRDEGVQIGLDRIGATDSELVGMLFAARLADAWHLMNIAVDPGERRRGIASQLLDVLFECISTDPDRGCTLEVRRSNAGAIALYERWGFTQAGIRPRYYGPEGEDAVIMWRPPEQIVRRRAAGEVVEWTHP
jgi:[ribosomal protein S18]-alanine N-acetyltransferase